jgi:hypothetical protein
MKYENGGLVECQGQGTTTGGIIMTRQNQSISEKTCHITTFSTINSTLSSLRQYHIGLKFNMVYHRAVLGPILFLIYINDFPLALNNSAVPILFAHDTSILVTDKNADMLDPN